MITSFMSAQPMNPNLKTNLKSDQALGILRPRAVFPTGANQSTIALANKNQKRYSQAID